MVAPISRGCKRRSSIADKEQVTPYKWPQRDHKNATHKIQVCDKLAKVRKVGYIEKGQVISLTSFFTVTKTSVDISIVYYTYVSGINDSVWAPWFALPTVRTHLRAVTHTTYMGMWILASSSIILS